MEHGRIQGVPKFLGVPPLSLERVGLKPRTSNLAGTLFYRANPNKSPLTILGKMERGRIQGLHKFFGYPLLFQEQVKLRI